MSISLMSADKIYSSNQRLLRLSGKQGTDIAVVTDIMAKGLQERRASEECLWGRDTDSDTCLKDICLNLALFLLSFYPTADYIERPLSREVTLESRRTFPYRLISPSMREEAQELFANRALDYVVMTSKLNILGPAMERAAYECSNIRLLH